MSELLSDEELIQQLKQVYRDGYYSNNNTGTDVFEAHLCWFREYINKQKRLYAEGVIGEDEPERVIVASYGQTRAVAGAATRNSLRQEQRARIK